MNQGPTEESSQGQGSEYDPAVAHTIWELERATRRGRASEATRRALVRAHAEQLRMTEERLGVEESERSFLLLQDRVAPAVLMLAGENEGCRGLQDLAGRLHRAGFGVLATTLAYRDSDNSMGPKFWQTCLDEAENRYDMLNHYAARISIIGVGLGAAIAMHLVSRKRIRAIVALFPVLDAHLGTGQSLRRAFRSLLPRRFWKPLAWPVQRRLATDGARRVMNQFTSPLLVIADERGGRGDTGRTLRVVRHLADRGVAKLHQVPQETGSPDSLSQAEIDLLLEFLKQRP